MVLNLFFFVQFHFHTFQQLKPMGSGSSKKLVLQLYNGGHGEMHFANGASPAAFVLWCFSGASEMLFLPSVVASLAQLWFISCSSLLKPSFPPVLCSSPAPLFAGCTFSLISIKFSSSLLSQTFPASSDMIVTPPSYAGRQQVSPH